MANCKEIWLSLDLTSPKGTLAIHAYHPNTKMELLTSKVITQNGNHSENLVPSLEESLKDCKLSMIEIDRFVTASGPGSFTGLRIALASLKAFAYNHGKPIELLSGSEARAIRWMKSQPKSVWKDLYVLTYITSERFVVAHLQVDSNNSLKFISERNHLDSSFVTTPQNSAIILDDRISKEKFTSTTQVFVFPLEAEFLGETLLQASTRKSYQSVAEWVQMSPNYFGSSNY